MTIRALSLVNVLSFAALAATIAACASPTDDGSDGARENAGALTAPADPGVLEPAPAPVDDVFVAAGQRCTNGGSLSTTNQIACRVGVTAASTTTPTYTTKWSILGTLVTCSTQVGCEFNASDGPKCTNEPDPANTYCGQTFAGVQLPATQFWGMGTIDSGYTPATWCAEKYTTLAATIQASAVASCNARANTLANGTRRPLTCCSAGTATTSAAVTTTAITAL